MQRCTPFFPHWLKDRVFIPYSVISLSTLGNNSSKMNNFYILKILGNESNFFHVIYFFSSTFYYMQVFIIMSQQQFLHFHDLIFCLVHIESQYVITLFEWQHTHLACGLTRVRIVVGSEFVHSVHWMQGLCKLCEEILSIYCGVPNDHWRHYETGIGQCGM